MPWFNDLLDPQRVGTVIRCRICGAEHPLEWPYRESSTADKHHAYVTCGGQKYFVGQFKDPGRSEVLS